ncbi:MAG: hypothetical protein H0U71_09035 [Gammaproteobacteria bacterium]|nr:hypothetical protein [Gammaproteobacteria bacterium]
MEKQNLIDILNGDIDLIGTVNERDIALYDMEVIFYPKHVKKMLTAYLNKKISAEDLTNWAGFICIRGEYCSPNYLDDEEADYYEDMFYVVQRLSTPEIDGDVNEARVKSYLTELDKYPDNPA